MSLIKINNINKNKLLSFLNDADTLFPIHLSDKVDINNYATKLIKKASILTIEKDNRVVGAICGYINPLAESYVSLLAILPKYQNKGYASKLIKKFIDISRKSNSTLVHLYTNKNNYNAISLYKKLGFSFYKTKHMERQNDIHYIYRLHDNYLITSIGSYSADIVIKTIKHNKNASIIGTDMYKKELIVNAYNVDYFYQVSKVADETKFKKQIMSIIKMHNINYIIPLTDVDVDFFNKYRNEFKNLVVCISSAETIEICRDKLKIKQFIDNNIKNINTIPTYTNKDILSKKKIRFPIIAKPKNGRSSQNITELTCKEELNLFLKNKNNFIFQPKIYGKIYTVDTVCNGDKCVAIARKEELRTKNGAGISVIVSPNRQLETACIKLAKALNIIGCVNFEFIKEQKSKKFFFVECNPRFSAGVIFSCLSGYDVITNHIKCFKNETLDDFKISKELFISRKYIEYITKVNS